MDTSKGHIETYVKMLEKAPEIQKEWIPKNGDSVWHPNEGVEYMGTWEYPEKFDIVHLSEDTDKDFWYNWLWFPHQSQLQEILLEDPDNRFNTSICSITLVCQFAKFLGIFDEDAEGRSNIYLRKESLEVLWLAFVMFELYQKVWDGKDWRKK